MWSCGKMVGVDWNCSWFTRGIFSAYHGYASFGVFFIILPCSWVWGILFVNSFSFVELFFVRNVTLFYHCYNHETLNAIWMFQDTEFILFYLHGFSTFKSVIWPFSTSYKKLVIWHGSTVFTNRIFSSYKLYFLSTFLSRIYCWVL